MKKSSVFCSLLICLVLGSISFATIAHAETIPPDPSPLAVQPSETLPPNP